MRSQARRVRTRPYPITARQSSLCALLAFVLACAPSLEAQQSTARARGAAPSARASGTQSRPPRSVAPSPGYRLGPGDVLGVSVARHPEMSVEEAPVNAAGRVSVPVVGQIAVSGKTLDQVQRELTSKFRVALVRPEVSVSLQQARAQTVSVLGTVENPGIFDLKPGWRVSDALAAAGGLTSRPEITEATLGRAKQKAAWLPLSEILNDPGSRENRLLSHGDTLRFAAQTVQVSIAGQVKNPGAFTVPFNSSVEDIIALAGGTTPTAALSQAAIKRRNESVPIAVDLLQLRAPGQSGSGPRVADGDLILVPETKARFSVLGAVQNPGTFNLEENSVVRASEAIARAGGLTGAPGSSRIVLTRRAADGTTRAESLDAQALLEGKDAESNVLMGDGDVLSVLAVSRKVYVSGEVKSPGAYEIKEGDSLPKAIALAGGASELASLQRITVQRNGAALPVDALAAMKQGAPLDFPLQDGDLVIVPRNTARVLVLGAVQKPGAVLMEEGVVMNVGEAIGLAGGVKDRAKLKEIGIFRNTAEGVQRQIVSLDQPKNGTLGMNQALQPGDTLYVPEGKTSSSGWDSIGRALPLLGLFF
jgi:polysaccharide export outer membrane protein